MSDTPRTDQQAREWDDGFSMPSDLIALARDLERENAALRAELEAAKAFHRVAVAERDAARKEAQP